MKTLLLKIILPVTIGIMVGRFITPLFGIDSTGGRIVISTGLTIALLIFIEGVVNKFINGNTTRIPLGDLKNLYKINKSEVSRATSVLTDAFKEDPLFKVLFGDPVKNANKYSLVTEFMVTYAYAFGDVYASSNQFEGIMAVTQDESTYMSIGHLIRSGSLYAFLKIGLVSFLRVVSALSPLDEVRQKYMKNRSFAYVQIIGVAKEHQGKGHGGKLLKELIAMADEVKIPLYLETETEENVRLYERFGFKVLEMMSLPLINEPMWIMLREINDEQ